jgi:hypothetical protein
MEEKNNKEYYIENNRVVFTEYYHLKRGYCCGSHNGCRHCPYEPKGKKGNTKLKKSLDN